MAYPSVTYTFVNGTSNIIDAGEVNTNFSDLISGLSDGTKDLSVNQITALSYVAPVYIGGTTPFVGASTGFMSKLVSTGSSTLSSIKTASQDSLEVNDAGNVSGTKYASYTQFKRTLDAARTDTSTIASLYTRFEIATAGFNYTNTVGTVVTGLYSLGIVASGGGAVAISNLFQVYLGSNSVTTTGRKTNLFVGPQTNGSVGTASISDNVLYTGAWFISSTSSSPSKLSGSLWLPGLKSGANQAAAGAAANEIWVDTSANNVLKLGV